MRRRERAEVRVAISGAPGVGKTTLALRLAQEARRLYSVGGFVTVEVREGGRRVGFDVVGLSSGVRVPLARVGRGEPAVGRYVVSLEACGTMSSLLREAAGSQLAVVDEIGAMEMKCPGFWEEAAAALRRAEGALAVVHRAYISRARELGLEVIWLTREAWDSVYSRLARMLGLD